MRKEKEVMGKKEEGRRNGVYFRPGRWRGRASEGVRESAARGTLDLYTTVTTVYLSRYSTPVHQKKKKPYELTYLPLSRGRECVFAPAL